jgi:hypothetical protein
MKSEVRSQIAEVDNQVVLYFCNLTSAICNCTHVSVSLW